MRRALYAVETARIEPAALSLRQSEHIRAPFWSTWSCPRGWPRRRDRRVPHEAAPSPPARRAALGIPVSSPPLPLCFNTSPQ